MQKSLLLMIVASLAAHSIGGPFCEAQEPNVQAGNTTVVGVGVIAETFAQDYDAGLIDNPPMCLLRDDAELNGPGGLQGQSGNAPCNSHAVAGRASADASSDGAFVTFIALDSFGSIATLEFSTNGVAGGQRSETIPPPGGAYARAGASAECSYRFIFRVLDSTPVHLQAMGQVAGSPWNQINCRIRKLPGPVIVEDSADTSLSSDPQDLTINFAGTIEPGTYLFTCDAHCGGGSDLHPWLSSTGVMNLTARLEFGQPVGACCLASGDCEVMPQQQCDSIYGIYRGSGTTCADVACVGACCLPDGGCELMTDYHCWEIEGRYNGDGSICSDVDCPPVLQLETTPLRTCKLTNARFQVTASCGMQAGDWTYRWWRYQPETDWVPLEDDGHILGSTTDTLRILGLRAADVSPTFYVVQVNGLCGESFGDSIMLEFKGEDLTNPDDNADGDGIPDCWETEGAGMDVNDDGIRDLDLYAEGARPNRKDLFVEVDSMVGLEMDSETALMVTRAFQQAPLGNPDGTTGIWLHLDRSESSLPWSSITNTLEIAYFGSTSKSDWFGTESDRNSANKDHIRAAKVEVYRYCIVVADLVLAAGVAEIGGDDFCVAFAQEATLDSPYYYVHRAEVFMHELGHSLGLWHNGADASGNYNPTYPSVMNYSHTFALNDSWIESRVTETGLSPVDDNETVWIDYCRLSSCGAQIESDTCGATLNELSINEEDWICYRNGVRGFWENWPVGYQDDEEMKALQMVSIGCRITGGHNLPDIGSPNFSLQLDRDRTRGVIQNLNWIPGAFPSPVTPLGQLHEPYNDWANIRFRGHDGGVVGLLAFTGELAPIEDEASPEWIQAVISLPISRSDCTPDEFPRVGSSPMGGVVSPGTVLQMSCSATGSEPFSYQWYRNGKVIPAATNAIYSIASARYGDAGEYKVLIANACGAVESVAATVTVPPIPGDLDLDGDVDLQDLAALLSAFGKCVNDPDFNPSADIVADGCIDLLDLTQLLSQFGQW